MKKPPLPLLENKEGSFGNPYCGSFSEKLGLYLHSSCLFMPVLFSNKLVWPGSINKKAGFKSLPYLQNNLT
jgi:hypothetical protein